MECGYVYAIDGGNGLIKLGKSLNPKERLLALQVGSPMRLSLLMSRKVPKTVMGEIESFSHKILQSKRSHGEWYSVSLSEISKAIEDAISYIDDAPNRTARLLGDVNDFKRGLMKHGLSLNDFSVMTRTPLQTVKRWSSGKTLAPGCAMAVLRTLDLLPGSKEALLEDARARTQS